MARVTIRHPAQVAPSWRKEAMHMTRAAQRILESVPGESAASQPRHISHRRLPSVVAQPCVHRPDLVALLEQMRRNAVPNGMTTEACGEPCRTTDPAHGPL